MTVGSAGALILLLLKAADLLFCSLPCIRSFWLSGTGERPGPAGMYWPLSPGCPPPFWFRWVLRR